MLEKKDRYTAAIVGATGAVGREMVSLLEERKFPLSGLRLFASELSAGSSMEFGDGSLKVQRLGPDAFRGVDIALFSAGEDISREYAPVAVKAGAVVIDNSAAWRMEPDVPLIVPEVNWHAVQRHRGLIANPNCSTIQMVMVLKPLHEAARVKRVVVSTYQAVSGTGKEAMEELMEQTRSLLSFQPVESKVYPYQIAFNCLPHIGSFNEAGECTEEVKLARETAKILENESVLVTATTVRVPVFHGHCEAVNVETERKLSPNEARAVLSTAPGVLVYDDFRRQLYPLPIDAAGRDAVYVGRIREDRTIPNGLNLWIVADNLRKGAALNTIQIAEGLILSGAGA